MTEPNAPDADGSSAPGGAGGPSEPPSTPVPPPPVAGAAPDAAPAPPPVPPVAPVAPARPAWFPLAAVGIVALFLGMVLGVAGLSIANAVWDHDHGPGYHSDERGWRGDRFR